ncbi:MAG: DUF423 domain-containing protein, partial [Planctomycetes bacterium]|nr:DUF423 domain-containing protein [Planctomycetota bacterium]
FGAHGLRGRLEPEALQVFEVAVRYQMYHALALVLVGLLAGRSSGSLAPCGWAFAAGIGLFSGSLYALALTGSRDWGRVAPFGGAAFLLGWGLLALKTLWPPRGEARK